MKNIAAQMVNFDREQMRRIANNMPEQYDEKPQVTHRTAISGRGWKKPLSSAYNSDRR